MLELFDQGVKYVFLAVFPITLVLTTLSKELLGIWLGEDFARNGALVLQILAIGVAITSLSNIPFALLQAADRAGLVGKLHLAELPVYAVAAWVMISHFGILGAAITWVARGVIDTLLLFMFASSLHGPVAHPIGRRLAPMTLTLLAFVPALALSPDVLPTKIAFLSLALTFFGVAGWRWGLSAHERTLAEHGVAAAHRRVRRAAVR